MFLQTKGSTEGSGVSLIRRFRMSGLALLLAVAGVAAHAQQLTGTISGTAYDQSGAVVPNANITLKNEGSGDTRTSVTDKSGHFAITSVQPATYTLDVTANGFSSWEEKGVVMGLGDNRDVPNIKLQVGGSAQSIEVVSGGDVAVPLDTAEVSTSLNQQMINDFPFAGRDAGELLRIAPGMALAAPTGGGFNDRIVGSNNGPVGSVSANGTQPNGTIAYMLDGANLVDPGNAGTQIANINPDMIGNIKILMSDYGAEFAKGPVIFEAFSRSGTKNYHGEAYLYTHNAALNSVDAYTKSQGGTNAAQSYYYMGGNVGGPVRIPFTKFNQNKDKLFFWGGYEYMKQQPAGSILNYNVPNAAQRNGDFSNAGIDATTLATLRNTWGGFYNELQQNVPTGGTATSVPTSAFDPLAKSVLSLYPTPNQTPTPGNGYTNYNYVNTSPQNRWEATGKLDYAISDNDKLTGSFTYQKESDLAPISVWWAPGWTLPYPSTSASQTTTTVILANYTHVFNPTTTNEAVFGRAHFTNPYKLANPSAANRQDVGFTATGLFGNTAQQIPNFEGPWGGTLANISQYPFSTGSFGGVKEVPSVYDNVTKVLGTHTIKGGFYWDDQHNYQNSNVPDNGTYNYGGSNISTNNYVADLELGNIASYSQQNVQVPQDIRWHQWSLYGQDSWKASKKLTLNYGLRFDHIGNWYGIPEGFQVWNPSTYVNSKTAAPANTGLSWHANDASIPLSGFPSRLFFYAPRLGFAYDILGTGKTVVRGGYATYYYQASTEVGNAGNGPQGSFSYTTNNAFKGYNNVSSFTPPSSVAQNGSTVYAMKQGDNRVPYTSDWNLTISQAMKWRSVLEVSWVGNRSVDEYLDGGNSHLGDLNNIAPGGFFQKDPTTGRYISPSAPGCGSDPSIYCASDPASYTPSFQANNFRPLVAYQDIFLLTHAPYSNYNSLQVNYQKQTGKITYVGNYTFSKVLGIRDGGTNNGSGNGTGVDPFVIQNNYGPLAYDHTNIINFTVNYSLPSPIHGSGFATRALGQAVNGWKATTYTAFQSGAPLQTTLAGNLNATWNALTTPTVNHPNLPDNSVALPNGLRATGVSASTWLGTNAYNLLVPEVTCDPTKNLKKGQRFNPACFTTPAYGQQGPSILPYMRAPNYWNSNLGVYKSFRLSEVRRIEIRANADNWLNHPLRQFGLANQLDSQLTLTQTQNATCAGCYTVNSDGTHTPLSVTSLAASNTNTQTTGTPAFKTGSRFVTLAAKFYF